MRQVRHLLHGRGREDEHVEIAVTGASCCLEVIGLRRLDAAEARAAALDVDDQRGQIRARHDSEMPSHLSAMPGLDEEVMARLPVDATP